MNIRKKLKEKPGFTLVETIIAITILVLIIGAISGIIITTLKLYPRQETKVSSQQIGQLVMERMVSDLRMAKAEGISFSNEVTVDPITGDPASDLYSRIEFDGKDNDGEMTRLAYELGNDNVLRYKQKDPDDDSWSCSPIANNVESLVFQDIDGDSALPHQLIKITMIISDERGNGHVVFTEVTPRL